MRRGPHYIQFYPTLRCNKSCGFCFNTLMPPVPDMPFSDFVKMLGTLEEAGVKVIDIIGGEPTLHPDIVAMAGEAAARGFTVNISSNGSDQKTLAELMHVGEAVTVGISINDGETLEQVSGFIACHRPVVKSVYNRHFDHELLRRILLLEPEKYHLIYRDALVRDELEHTVPFTEYFEAVEKHSPDGSIGKVYCGGFIVDAKQHPELARVRCPAGTTKLGIAPDGSVYPCNLFIGNKEFRLGNILHDAFGAIWAHPALDWFRVPGTTRCTRNGCRFHDECHGGCPAHGYSLSGDLAMPDARCLRD